MQVNRLDQAGASDETVRRFDFGALGGVTRTPQGGFRVDAGLTRSGVFLYYDQSGQAVREYRPPDEVFDAESLATLSSAPVTDLHPPEMVGPENFVQYSRGHVAEGTVKKEGSKVVASLVIQDGHLMETVERKDRTQVSAGYRCKMDPTPGTSPEGEKYDTVQRKIRYNHVAIVRNGRAGSDVALRLDAAGHAQPPGAEEKTTMNTIRIDGVDYPLGTAAEQQAAALAQTRFQTKLDAAQAQLDATAKGEKTRADSLQTKLDAASAKAATDAAALAAATDPKKLDAAVEARTTLLGLARGVLGADEKLDGLTPKEIMVKAVTKARPDVPLEGRSDDFISGMFYGLPAVKTDEDPDGLNQLRRDAAGSPPGKGKGTPDVDPDDDEAPPDAAKAKKKMDKANRTAWKEPLTYSKDPPVQRS